MWPQFMDWGRSKNGRGDRFRTRDLRIWSPLLYQLSYSPRHMQYFPSAPRRGAGKILSLALAVELVAPAITAVLLELELARGGALVLESGVILALALGAEKMDDVGHGLIL